MKHSNTYKIFITLTLLTFLCFQTGFAIAEYYCSMGMQMELPPCVSCHADNDTPVSEATWTNKSGSTCCTTILYEIETIDIYIKSTPDTQNSLKVNPAFIGILEFSDSTFEFIDIFNAEIPPTLFLLHGISGQIFFSSYLI